MITSGSARGTGRPPRSATVGVFGGPDPAPRGPFPHNPRMRPETAGHAGRRREVGSRATDIGDPRRGRARRSLRTSTGDMVHRSWSPLRDEPTRETGLRRAHPVRRAIVGVALCLVALAATALAGRRRRRHPAGPNSTACPAPSPGWPTGRTSPPTATPSGRQHPRPRHRPARGRADDRRRCRGTRWLPGAQRSDTIMVLHLSGDRRTAARLDPPRRLGAGAGLRDGQGQRRVLRRRRPPRRGDRGAPHRRAHRPPRPRRLDGSRA